jgi:hypothetical protein
MSALIVENLGGEIESALEVVMHLRVNILEPGIVFKVQRQLAVFPPVGCHRSWASLDDIFREPDLERCV